MTTRLFRDPEEERYERQKEDKKKMQAHSTNHSSMASAGRKQSNGQFSVEYLQQLLDDDHHIETETMQLISVLLNKNWVLSQLKSEEITEFKWIKRALKKKIYAEHPPDGSPIQGEYRKFVFDDSKDALSPLTQRQRNEIDQLLLTVFAQDTRSRGGWQQEQIGKTTTVSEYKDNSDQESGGLFSF